MASYVTPKKGVEFIFYISLVSQASTKVMQSNPTIAAGDFKVSIDGGALANPATLPAVTPASSKMVKVTLSTSEMNGDNITFVASDASGAEWCDLVVNIQTSARQIDDLTYPTVSGRSTDVSAGGEVGIDWANIGSPTTTVALTGTTAGLIDNAITAAKIATNAIDDDALAADAVTAIQSGLATAASLTTVEGKIDIIDTNVDSILVDTGTDGVVVAAGSKTGYTLSAAGIQAIWDALTSALTTVGSIGKRIADNLDATISSRLASASYTTPPTAAANADAVWDETLADHLAAGSTGNALNAAGSAGDPWSTALPGAYGAGSAGNIIGNNLNAAVSSRATPAQVNTEADTALADVGLTSTVTGRIDVAISTRLATAGYTAPPTVADILAGVIEGSITLKGALRLALAALAGKVTGGGTATVNFRDTGDTKNRITATVDANGNRTAVTRDITD